MESLKQWLQDWSDACEYANECAPDLTLFTPQEPYTALLGVAAVCFCLCLWNERCLQRTHAAQGAPELPLSDANSQLEELKRILEQAQPQGGVAEKQAA